jgi:hypothetical protein
MISKRLPRAKHDQLDVVRSSETSVCLSVCLSVSLSVCLSACLPLSFCGSVHTIWCSAFYSVTGSNVWNNLLKIPLMHDLRMWLQLGIQVHGNIPRQTRRAAHTLPCSPDDLINTVSEKIFHCLLLFFYFIGKTNGKPNLVDRFAIKMKI